MNSKKDSQKEPLISVVAVCYNHERYVRETLESIKNQTYRNLEVFVIDDCSQDNSVNEIESWIKQNYFQCTFVKHRRNIGLCRTLNEFLNICKGKYYQPISCDDILLPFKIEDQVEFFERLPDNIAMIYSDSYLINEDSILQEGQFIQKYKQFKKFPEGKIFDILIDGNFIPGMSVLIKTKKVLELGGYDERIRLEDFDLILRLAKNNEIKYFEKATCKYRLHDQNFHKVMTDQIKDYYWIYKKHYENDKCKLKLNSIALILYQNGKVKSQEYRDFVSSFGLPKGNGRLLNWFMKKGLSYGFYKRIRYLKGV